MVGAARLSRETYEEVEADTTANGSAVAVVILFSLAAAIGLHASDPRSIFGVFVVSLVTWLVWVLLTLFIGTRLLPESTTRADFGQVLRTTGYSTSVGIAVVGIWMLVSFVIAIRQALDYSSTARAFAVCVLGWIIHWVLLFGFVRTAI
jgi:hypothetical protein